MTILDSDCRDPDPDHFWSDAEGVRDLGALRYDMEEVEHEIFRRRIPPEPQPPEV